MSNDLILTFQFFKLVGQFLCGSNADCKIFTCQNNRILIQMCFNFFLHSSRTPKNCSNTNFNNTECDIGGCNSMRTYKIHENRDFAMFPFLDGEWKMF